MATTNVKITLAWWFKPYIYTLAAFCALFDCDPSTEHLNRVIDRAVRVK